MNTRILASELTNATGGYFDFQRREVRVRSQEELLLISDSAIRAAAELMAHTCSASIAFGVASGVHEDEDGRWSFVTCIAGSNSQTGHSVATFSRRHSLRQATVKFAVKSKCSIAEALWMELELPSTLSVEAMLTGNNETDDLFFLQSPLEDCCVQLTRRTKQAHIRESKDPLRSSALTPILREPEPGPFEFQSKHTGLGGGLRPGSPKVSTPRKCEWGKVAESKIEVEPQGGWGNSMPSTYLHKHTGPGANPYLAEVHPPSEGGSGMPHDEAVAALSEAPGSQSSGLRRSATYEAAATLLAKLNDSYSSTRQTTEGAAGGAQGGHLASGSGDTWNGLHSFPYLKKNTGLGGGLKYDTPAFNWDDPVNDQQGLYAPTTATSKPTNRWQFSSLQQYHDQV